MHSGFVAINGTAVASATRDSRGRPQCGLANLPGQLGDIEPATKLAAQLTGCPQWPIRISQEFAGDDDCVGLSGNDDVLGPEQEM